MNIFIYDKTFEGLLAVVFDAFTLKRFPDALYGPEDILPLIAEAPHRVELTKEKPLRVFAALRGKLSEDALRSLLYAWLSELPGSEMSLCRYIGKALVAVKSIENDLADPDVWEIVRLRRKVGKEAERYLGFVRFQKSKDNVYFSSITPKYNVIPLLSGHLAERFHDQPWLLYDLARHYGLLFRPEGPGQNASTSRPKAGATACANCTRSSCSPGCPRRYAASFIHDAVHGVFEEVFLDEKRLEAGFLRKTDLAGGETLLEELWRGYCAATAIEERHNPRLQRNFMPKRFWGLLTEKRHT